MDLMEIYMKMTTAARDIYPSHANSYVRAGPVNCFHEWETIKTTITYSHSSKVVTSEHEACKICGVLKDYISTYQY